MMKKSKESTDLKHLLFKMLEKDNSSTKMVVNKHKNHKLGKQGELLSYLTQLLKQDEINGDKKLESDLLDTIKNSSNLRDDSNKDDTDSTSQNDSDGPNGNAFGHINDTMKLYNGTANKKKRQHLRKRSTASKMMHNKRKRKDYLNHASQEDLNLEEESIKDVTFHKADHHYQSEEEITQGIPDFQRSLKDKIDNNIIIEEDSESDGPICKSKQNILEKSLQSVMKYKPKGRKEKHQRKKGDIPASLNDTNPRKRKDKKIKSFIIKNLLHNNANTSNTDDDSKQGKNSVKSVDGLENQILQLLNSSDKPNLSKLGYSLNEQTSSYSDEDSSDIDNAKPNLYKDENRAFMEAFMKTLQENYKIKPKKRKKEKKKKKDKEKKEIKNIFQAFMEFVNYQNGLNFSRKNYKHNKRHNQGKTIHSTPNNYNGDINISNDLYKHLKYLSSIKNPKSSNKFALNKIAAVRDRSKNSSSDKEDVDSHNESENTDVENKTDNHANVLESIDFSCDKPKPEVKCNEMSPSRESKSAPLAKISMTEETNELQTDENRQNDLESYQEESEAYDANNTYATNGCDSISKHDVHDTIETTESIPNGYEDGNLNSVCQDVYDESFEKPRQTVQNVSDDNSKHGSKKSIQNELSDETEEEHLMIKPPIHVDTHGCLTASKALERRAKAQKLDNYLAHKLAELERERQNLQSEEERYARRERVMERELAKKSGKEGTWREREEIYGKHRYESSKRDDFSRSRSRSLSHTPSRHHKNNSSSDDRRHSARQNRTLYDVRRRGSRSSTMSDSRYEKIDTNGTMEKPNQKRHRLNYFTTKRSKFIPYRTNDTKRRSNSSSSNSSTSSNEFESGNDMRERKTTLKYEMDKNTSQGDRLNKAKETRSSSQIKNSQNQFQLDIDINHENKGNSNIYNNNNNEIELNNTEKVVNDTSMQDNGNNIGDAKPLYNKELKITSIESQNSENCVENNMTTNTTTVQDDVLNDDQTEIILRARSESPEKTDNCISVEASTNPPVTNQCAVSLPLTIHAEMPKRYALSPTQPDEIKTKKLGTKVQRAKGTFKKIPDASNPKQNEALNNYSDSSSELSSEASAVTLFESQDLDERINFNHLKGDVSEVSANNKQDTSLKFSFKPISLVKPCEKYAKSAPLTLNTNNVKPVTPEDLIHLQKENEESEERQKLKQALIVHAKKLNEPRNTANQDSTVCDSAKSGIILADTDNVRESSADKFLMSITQESRLIDALSTDHSTVKQKSAELLETVEKSCRKYSESSLSSYHEENDQINREKELQNKSENAQQPEKIYACADQDVCLKTTNAVAYNPNIGEKQKSRSVSSDSYSSESSAYEEPKDKKHANEKSAIKDDEPGGCEKVCDTKIGSRNRSVSSSITEISEAKDKSQNLRRSCSNDTKYSNHSNRHSSNCSCSGSYSCSSSCSCSSYSGSSASQRSGHRHKTSRYSGSSYSSDSDQDERKSRRKYRHRSRERSLRRTPSYSRPKSYDSKASDAYSYSSSRERRHRRSKRSKNRRHRHSSSSSSYSESGVSDNRNSGHSPDFRVSRRITRARYACPW